MDTKSFTFDQMSDTRVGDFVTAFVVDCVTTFCILYSFQSVGESITSCVLGDVHVLTF